MKNFMKNIQYLFAPALPFDFAQDKLRLPSRKAWISVVGLVFVLGLSCNVVAMENDNTTGDSENVTSSEHTSGSSKKTSVSRTKIQQERGGSNIPTKDQAAQQRSQQRGAPQKPAVRK